MDHFLVLIVVFLSGLRFLPLHCGEEPQRRSQRPWASSALLVVKTSPRAPSGAGPLGRPRSPLPASRSRVQRPLGRLLCRRLLLPGRPVGASQVSPPQAAHAGPQQGLSQPQSTGVPGTKPHSGHGANPRGGGGVARGSVGPSLSCCLQWLHVVPRPAGALRF